MQLVPEQGQGSNADPDPRPDPSPPVLGPGELGLLNAASLAYIRSLSPTDIARRIDAVSIDRIAGETGLAEASEILAREGILIVRDFLERHSLEAAAGATARVTAALDAATPARNFEDDAILVQSSNQDVKGYTALTRHPKAVATIRRGADEGMIDVFNFDRLAGEAREALRQPFTRDWLLRLIAAEGAELTAENLNLYLNRGITRTRGFHADSFRKSLKGFVYLSDVERLDDGPYCFVRRSHADGPWRMANSKISELATAATETPFVDIGMIVPVVAPAGSLILSDQAGFHRGIPQSPDAERRVLVMRYR